MEDRDGAEEPPAEEPPVEVPVRKQAKPFNGTELQERLGSIYAACCRGILIRVYCPEI
jgi:hypothetical protein